MGFSLVQCTTSHCPGDSVPLESVDTENVTDGLTMEIAKLKSADAQTLYDRLDVGHECGYKVETTLGDVDAGGCRTISSTLTKSGLLLLVRSCAGCKICAIFCVRR